MTTRTAPDTFAPATNRSLRLALLHAATLLLAGSAQAQSANCDKLRQTLSQRIEAGGVTGYGLDILPAKSPNPGGGKVIGTCDGGAYKAVYRRFGGPAPATAEAAPLPAPAPPPPAQAPTPVALKPNPKPEPEPPRPVPAPPPPPVVKAPEPAPPPPAPAPAPAPAVIAAVAEPPPAVASAPSTSSPAVAATESAASQPEEQPPKTSMLRHGLLLFSGDWRWLWALLLLPLGGWLWAWANHRRQFDAAGLPRGPRL